MMTNEEKRIRTNQRQKAVRDAWKREKQLIENEQGTRDWSINEQNEIFEHKRVKGYEGHHMKSVSEYPKYADVSDNIQFLTRDEHIDGAHSGDSHNACNGYYNAETKTTETFGFKEVKSLPIVKLSESYRNDEVNMDIFNNDDKRSEVKLENCNDIFQTNDTTNNNENRNTTSKTHGNKR